jgi:formylglycine-generating enzyme
MKNFKVSLLLIIALTMFFSCDDSGKSNDNNLLMLLGGKKAGTKTTFSVPAIPISWNMVYVPGKTFPTGTDDSGTATVPEGYWIGETEVTYELWFYVHNWGAGHGYTFLSDGVKGNDGAGGKSVQNPVTTISWRDAMVWCNALTEWYNAYNGTTYTCVYWGSLVVLRNSTLAAACDAAVVDPSATGFRLLTKNEWELAARWRSDDTNTVSGYSRPYFTKGNSASGATDAYTNDAASGLVGVYNTTSTAVVMSKGASGANSLGIYDMSGNVSEFCFDLQLGTNRYLRGGNWNDGTAAFMEVGQPGLGIMPSGALNTLGFRIGRN